MKKTKSEFTIYYDQLTKSFTTGMVALVTLAPAVILLINQSLYGLIFIILFLAYYSIKKGITFDFNLNRYRPFIEICLYKTGSWKQISEIDYFESSKSKLGYRFASRSSISDISEMTLKVDLFNSSNNIIHTITSSNIKSVEEVLILLEETGVERKSRPLPIKYRRHR